MILDAPRPKDKFKQLNECGVTETEIAMMETSQMQSAWKKRRQEDSECPAWARAVSWVGVLQTPPLLSDPRLVDVVASLSSQEARGWRVRGVRYEAI